MPLQTDDENAATLQIGIQVLSVRDRRGCIHRIRHDDRGVGRKVKPRQFVDIDEVVDIVVEVLEASQLPTVAPVDVGDPLCGVGRHVAGSISA